MSRSPRASACVAALRGRVTGLAWPTYVLDIPGGHGKVPLNPGYLDPDDHVRDPAGQRHALRSPAAERPRLAGERPSV